MWKSAFLAFGLLGSTLFVGDEEAPKLANGLSFDGTMIVELKVKDLSKSVAWYRDVLGCDLVFEMAEMGWAEMTTPVASVYIGLGVPEEGKPVVPNRAGSIVLGIKDIEAARKKLVGHGAKVEEIMEIPGTVKLMTFYDLDGNTLKLAQNLMPQGG